MTATIEKALAYTARWEGGKVDDPDDPGKATAYGVSLRFLLSLGDVERYDYDADGDLDADDIALMPKADAQAALRKFWRDGFDSLDQAMATKIYDFSVNMGPKQAGLLVQRTYNATDGALWEIQLAVDGDLGRKSIAALGNVSGPGVEEFLLALEDRAARFYYDLAEKRAASRKYLFGWLRRCYSRPEVSS